jgi:hypothetical protein
MPMRANLLILMPLPCAAVGVLLRAHHHASRAARGALMQAGVIGEQITQNFTAVPPVQVLSTVPGK